MKLTPWICRWLAVLAFLTTAAANAAAATKTGHREGIERMIGGHAHLRVEQVAGFEQRQIRTERPQILDLLGAEDRCGGLTQ